MQEELIYIANMDSPRDVLLVSRILDQLGLKVMEIEMGTAAYINLVGLSSDVIRTELESRGYMLQNSNDKAFGEEVRAQLSAYIDQTLLGSSLQPLPDYLALNLKASYFTLNQQYSMLAGRSIAEFYERLRIERVKALLHNANLTLAVIAERLAFGDQQQLRRSFAEVTGQSLDSYLNRGAMLDRTAAA